MPTSNLLRELRSLLSAFVEGIDKGNTNISDDEARFLLEAARSIVDPKLSKYQATRYLNLDNTKQFDYLVKTGKIPQGRKEAGFKEKFWYKKDLENIPRDN